MKNYFEQWRHLRSLGYTSEEVQQILQERMSNQRSEQVLPQSKTQTLAEVLVPLVQTQLRLLQF